MEYYGSILKKYKLFQLNFSEKSLLSLSIHMKEMTIGPSEIVYNDRDYDKRFYYLNKGYLELFK